MMAFLETPDQYSSKTSKLNGQGKTKNCCKLEETCQLNEMMDCLGLGPRTKEDISGKNWRNPNKSGAYVLGFRLLVHSSSLETSSNLKITFDEALFLNDICYGLCNPSMNDKSSVYA